jgi:hypothetical protein
MQVSKWLLLMACIAAFAVLIIGCVALPEQGASREDQSHVHVQHRNLGACQLSSQTSAPAQAHSGQPKPDPRVVELIAQIDEDNLMHTVNALQAFRTRVFKSEENMKAADYLFKRLGDLDGLEVSFHNGQLRNIIAMYPGTDPASDKIYMVGAHYDSTSSGRDAQGATDDAIGVAIVLEYARILTQHKFKHSIAFALWNAEERGLQGSRAYAEKAKLDGLDIALYVNYDSAGYDPKSRLIIDLISNVNSRWAADKLQTTHELYEIGLNKINRVTVACKSDYTPFWEQGFPAITTHTESHGPAHTPADTADKVSTPYAKKNAQLGMSLLIELADIR